MTTAVFRMAREERPSLVCHLRSTSPQEAIAKLAKAGVLAIEGAEPSSIVLVGYHLEIRNLLRDFRMFDGEHFTRHSYYVLTKLRRLALTG
jgi:hypothetical protein